MENINWNLMHTCIKSKDSEGLDWRLPR